MNRFIFRTGRFWLYQSKQHNRFNYGHNYYLLHTDTLRALAFVLDHSTSLKLVLVTWQRIRHFFVSRMSTGILPLYLNSGHPRFTRHKSDGLCVRMEEKSFYRLKVKHVHTRLKFYSFNVRISSLTFLHGNEFFSCHEN